MNLYAWQLMANTWLVVEKIASSEFGTFTTKSRFKLSLAIETPLHPSNLTEKMISSILFQMIEA